MQTLLCRAPSGVPPGAVQCATSGTRQRTLLAPSAGARRGRDTRALGGRARRSAPDHGYLLNAGQLEYDCRYAKTPGMPTTGGPRL